MTDHTALQRFVHAAAALGIDEAATVAFVSRQLRARRPDGRPWEDARMRPYRARVRLYTARDGFNEPQADTDPELPANADGALIVNGLAAAGALVHDVAHDFHRMTLFTLNLQASHDVPPPVIVGLEVGALNKRLGSLRVSLSRGAKDSGESRGVWRLAYTVNGAEWLARVDIARK